MVSGRKRRVFRRLEEKLRIVKLTLEPGASVAGIALANGVNANQVFRWKRQYERGELKPRGLKRATALVPVTIAAEPEAPKLVESSIQTVALPSAGSITIEFPGRALLSIEGAADPAVIRAVLGEPRAMIELRAGMRIWLAAEITDMRRCRGSLTSFSLVST